MLRLLVLHTAICAGRANFVPPGAAEDVQDELFGVGWEFEANPRLLGRRISTIDTVNDWHYAMVRARFQFPS